jgi:hypothetical protein
MLFMRLNERTTISAEQFMKELQQRYGIIIRPYSVTDRSFRLVTHYWITAEHVGQVIDAVRAIVAPGLRSTAAD